MKKKFVLPFFLTSLFFGHLSYSQIVKYSFSQEFPTIKKHVDMGFYQFDKNIFAQTYYRHEEGMVFQIFDEKFNKIKKQEIVRIKQDGYSNEGLFCVKNDFFWLYSTWKRSEEKEQLWALPLDKQAFKLGEKPIKLSESGKLASQMGYDKYRFYYSNDSAMMMMTCRLKPKERRDKINKDVIGFNLYDSQMKTLYSHEIEMPYTEADMDILGNEIDSKGNIYLLANVALNNSIDGEKKENKGLYRYDLMRVNQKTNTMESIKFSLDNKFVNTSILSEDLLGNIIITGYYSNGSGGGIDGAYITRIELDEKSAFKKLNTTYCEFPKEVLQAYESERTKRKMDRRDKKDDLEASNLRFRKVIFDSEGGITIIGEEYYVVVHTSTSSNGSTTTSYTYYYDNILVLKANKNGKTEWCQKIPKYQKGKKDDDLGFFSHSAKGNTYFFYLDNAKNAKLGLNEMPALHAAGKGGFLTCVKIDGSGQMTKQSVFDTKKEKVKLRPRSFETVDRNLVVDRLKEDRKTSKVFRLEVL
ncbi:hypothetical protein [Aurantibacillus circumpalustris]|uniref:hypothetical protein n=1 Tax=Aurantibacillus circumpalustris TaxID=3036359 RepID=UPI00295B62D2|nr:hypothetical protein [Aurantibacillus circumpalustris]